MTRRKKLGGLLALSLAGLIAVAPGCATSPTGRKQLILMPDGQMDALGSRSFEEMKATIPVSRDPAVTRYTRCVADALTREVGGDWEVVVFDQPKTVNAFALPGGKIGVFTGLLGVAKTSDQLATVIGHEIGHVLAKHGNERVSEAFAVQGGLLAASVLTRENPKRDLLLAALGVGSHLAVVLPHSRTQESESDLIGLQLMSRAGFDPRAAAELWRNMASEGGGRQPPEFLSTHPSHGTRIRDLEEKQGEYLPVYDQARADGKRPNCTR